MTISLIDLDDDREGPLSPRERKIRSRRRQAEAREREESEAASLLAETARIAREAIQAEADRTADMIVYRTLADVFSDPAFWPSKPLFLSALEEAQDRIREALQSDEADARLQVCVDAIRDDRVARRAAGKSKACSHARRRGVYTCVTPQVSNAVTVLRIADRGRDVTKFVDDGDLGGTVSDGSDDDTGGSQGGAPAERGADAIEFPEGHPAGGDGVDLDRLEEWRHHDDDPDWDAIIRESMGLDEKGYYRG